MKNIIFTILCLLLANGCFSFQKDSVIKISEDIQLIKIKENVYVTKTYKNLEKWGRIDANGMILIDTKDITMINTPWDNKQTKTLCDNIERIFRRKIKTLIVTHSHDDCMGGFDEIKKRNITAYSLDKTAEFAKKAGVSGFSFLFSDSLSLKYKKFYLNVYYPGGGHTVDNIVVWLPKQKILYAGCLVKEMSAKTLGNTSEADLDAYPKTIQNLIDKYHNAEIVVPGHGQWGGIDLVRHTLELTGPKK